MEFLYHVYLLYAVKGQPELLDNDNLLMYLYSLKKAFNSIRNG